ncbi:hypothetical protein BDW72DRAFT_158622 [Aspergillus terricola var. indicus]
MTALTVIHTDPGPPVGAIHRWMSTTADIRCHAAIARVAITANGPQSPCVGNTMAMATDAAPRRALGWRTILPHVVHMKTPMAHHLRPGMMIRTLLRGLMDDLGPRHGVTMPHMIAATGRELHSLFLFSLCCGYPSRRRSSHIFALWCSMERYLVL